MNKLAAMLKEATSDLRPSNPPLSAFRGFCCIGLHQPKVAANVGSALRAAGCYGADFVAVTGHRYLHASTDTQKMLRHLPLLTCQNLQDVMPVGATPVAIDLIDGAIPLPSYIHPEQAFYVFGPEDGTLDKTVLSWCKQTVYVPTHRCMNLAATINVVLYDRLVKMMARKEKT